MKVPKKHNDWVKAQFDSQRRKADYRNVMIHTGLIENVIEDEAGYKENFSVAIKILRFSKRYDGLDKIEKLRKLRNKIVHRIELDKLDEKEINKTRDEMHTLLKEIYKDNLLIKDYFQSKYKIDTTKF